VEEAAAGGEGGRGVGGDEAGEGGFELAAGVYVMLSVSRFGYQ